VEFCAKKRRKNSTDRANQRLFWRRKYSFWTAQVSNHRLSVCTDLLKLSLRTFQRKGEKVFFMWSFAPKTAQKLHGQGKPTIILAPEIFVLNGAGI